MAKAPYAKVSKTSGQGVSRLSYQAGYRLGNRGTGTPGGGKDTPSVRSERSDSSSSGKSSGKSKLDKVGGINISYGQTLPISELGDIEELGKRKPGKTPGFMKLGKPVSRKEGKRDAGFLKGKK